MFVWLPSVCLMDCWTEESRLRGATRSGLERGLLVEFIRGMLGLLSAENDGLFGLEVTALAALPEGDGRPF